MSPILIGFLGIVFMFVLILFQVPIGISMIVVGLLGFGVLAGFGSAASILSTEFISKISSTDNLVLPLFLLMGTFSSVAGLSGDIYRLANAVIGHRRGGLAVGTVVGCGFFGAICGSSAATTATFSRVSLPEMTSRNYSRPLATGCIAAGGCLGTLVPPSVPLVIYGVMTEQFIVSLFVAAIVPAVLAVILFLLAIVVYARIFPEAAPAGARTPIREMLLTLRKCWGAVVLVIAVLGGIYGGIFTVNEGAAVGAGLSLIFVIIRKALTKENAWEIIRETVVSTGMIYMIMIGAGVFAYFITVSQLPAYLVTMINQANVPNWLTLMLLLLVYLILGSVFDTMAAMLITLPFVVPIIQDMGYSLIWWGMMNMMIIELGILTPPIGLNIFVIHGVSKQPLSVIYRGVVPFIVVLLLELVILAVFPGLVTYLPDLLM